MDQNISDKKIAELVAQAGDLVDKVLRHLLSSGVGRSVRGQTLIDVDELKAYGAQGLVEAALRFDPSQGSDFRRYAYFRVRGAMVDGLRKMGNWSRRGYERVSMLRAMDSALDEESHLFTGQGTRSRQHSSRDCDDSAETANEERERLEREAEQAHEKLREHMSHMVTAMLLGVFASPAREGDEVVGLSSTPDAEELVYERQLRHRLLSAIEALDEPERSVIERHYLKGESLLEIGAFYGHSKSWASRQHTNALKRLQFRMREAL